QALIELLRQALELLPRPPIPRCLTTANSISCDPAWLRGLNAIRSIETARVHIASRQRDRVAARGPRAAGARAADRAANGNGRRSGPRVTALKQGLQELGWTDGGNIQIETPFGGADAVRIRSHAAELVALAPDWSKRRGPGLRLAVPRLQYSNDETLPKSSAVREDHHADTTQIHRHDAGRRPSAHHKRTTGAAAARKQAHDRRRPGAFLESKFVGLALGSGCQAAIAGTIHHRARAANDGRSWRRPRSHRAAGPERP